MPAVGTRRLTVLLAALVVGGCARTLREAEMQDPATVGSIARTHTESQVHLTRRPARIAIVGMVATFDDDGQDSDTLTGLANQASALVNDRTGKALDQALRQSVATLNGLGFPAVAPETVRRALATSPVPPGGMPLLVRAPGLPVQLGLDPYLGSVISLDNCKPADLAPLFPSLQADGLLAAFFQNQERQVMQAGLVLVMPGPDGKPQIAWRGRVKPGSIAVEANTWDSFLVNETAQQESLTRLFAHSFRLLAARMAQDLPVR